MWCTYWSYFKELLLFSRTRRSTGWHGILHKARPATRLTTSWLMGPAGAHYKIYVFGEVRLRPSSAVRCFEAQSKKDLEATSQTPKVRYRKLRRPNVAKVFVLVLREKNKFQDRGSKIDFSNPASRRYFSFHPAIPPLWTFSSRSRLVKLKLL